MKFWFTELWLFYVISKTTNPSIILSDDSTSSTSKHGVSNESTLCHEYILTENLWDILSY